MSTPQNVRLTSGARILRGSKRIGAFLAVPICLAGAALSIDAGYKAANRATSTYAQVRCLTQKTDAYLAGDQFGSAPAQFRLADNGCPGPAYSVTEAEMRANLAERAPAFAPIMASEASVGLMLSVLAAVCVFGLCWSLGWVVAGFTPD